MRRDFPRKSRGAFGVSGLRIACLETARPEVKSCEAGGWEEEKNGALLSTPLHPNLHGKTIFALATGLPQASPGERVSFTSVS